MMLRAYSACTVDYNTENVQLPFSNNKKLLKINLLHYM